MKNVTLSIDDETWRRARIVAAHRNQSVSALVREYLLSLNTRTDSAEARTVRLFEILDRSTGYSAAKRMSREQAHERRRVS